MSCPTELTCCRYLDGALPRNEAAEFASHLKACPSCAAQAELLRRERDSLRLAMQEAVVGDVIPSFVPRPTISRLLTWLGWTALGIWGISMAWMGLADAISLPSWLAWLSPDALGVSIGLLVSGVLQATGSTDLLPAAIGTAQSLALAVLALAAFGWLVRHQPGRAAAPCLALALFSTLMISSPEGQAFEIRHDENRIVVPAGEIIDDTLIVSAENIVIDGEVTGDLIAFGETVTLRGRVGGMLLALGETVNLEGVVAHSVISMGESVDARNADLGANFYGAGESVTIHPGARIAGNGLLVASELEVRGSIGKGLTGLARTLTLFGSVAGDMKAFASRAELTSDARVGGNLSLTTRDSDSAVISPEATVAGETELTTRPERPSRYASGKFYLGRVLHLLAAFVTGLALFRLLPTLADVRLDTGAEALTTAGIGAVALIATPALALAALLTLIGAPLGIFALLLWGISLYVAGIIVAWFLGALILTKRDGGPALPLLLGLSILLVLTNLPLIGGPVTLVTVIVGLGMIAQWLRANWRGRSEARP